VTQEDLVPPRSRLRSRVLLFAALLLAIAATLRLAGSAAFAVDPDLGRFAAGSAKQQHHNCFTGYVIAAYLASRTQRAVYDPKNYRGTSDPTPVHEGIGRRFSIDSFPYPPQFLLLPVGLLQISSSFLTLRAIWFVLCVSVLATGLIVSAFWAGGTRRPSWLWLLPGGVLVANGVIFTLQIGNVHPIVVSLSVLAMIVFERRNAWALAFGGAILSFAILTKLWPATLLLYLLFRRRFAAVGATLGWCALWSLVTWLTLGGHVFSEFFNDQLPALASGAAFPFAFHIPQAIVTSAALVSIPAKLHWLGLLAATPAMMPAWIVWPNTVLLVFLVVWAARMHDTRSVSRTTRLATWLAILTLVQLRSRSCRRPTPSSRSCGCCPALQRRAAA